MENNTLRNDSFFFFLFSLQGDVAICIEPCGTPQEVV